MKISLTTDVSLYVETKERYASNSDTYPLDTSTMGTPYLHSFESYNQ
jgi:hypothetical protein